MSGKNRNGKNAIARMAIVKGEHIRGVFSTPSTLVSHLAGRRCYAVLGVVGG
jgi:hypothetical protein